ncbi:hypothetical protein [Novosphingobium profundi]|uniref:hypothetical protein n=1 Tax=Novosphingobium profundi TaxID=1774954 RepID=UPI0039B12456
MTAGVAGTKTKPPLVEVPQPLTVIHSERYVEQGAINISDTVKRPRHPLWARHPRRRFHHPP